MQDQPTTDSVRDAYRKHSTELLAIDEAQTKLVLISLAVFSAGASLLSNHKSPLAYAAKIGLTIIAFAVTGVAWHANRELGSLRTDVRRLLVGCERMLGFFTPSTLLPGATLYSDDELRFPQKGGWHQAFFIMVVAAAIGFLIIVWFVGELP